VRRILYTLLGLMLWVSTSQAQITNASSTDFVILLPPAADSRLRAATDSVRWMSDNRIGTILIADTAWSHNANADSLEAYTKGRDMYWVITGDGRSADSLVYLRIEEYLTSTGSKLQTKRDTLNFRAPSGPQGGHNGASHTDANTFSMAPGFNLHVSAWSTFTAVNSINWATYLYSYHSVGLVATDAGELKVQTTIDLSEGDTITVRTSDLDTVTVQIVNNDTIYIHIVQADTLQNRSAPRLDSLRIISADTMSPGDTTFSVAIPGQYGYVSLFIQDAAGNNDSLFRAVLGYQVRLGASDWAGPADTALAYFPLLDSLVIDSGQTRAYWVSTTPATEVRFLVIDKNTLGRQVIGWLKAMWRD